MKNFSYEMDKTVIKIKISKLQARAMGVLDIGEKNNFQT
jgi:hypothetical protein